MAEIFKEQWEKIRDSIANEEDKFEIILKVDHFYSSVVNNVPTNPTFRFAIGQEVWFIKNDTVQKGNVRVRQITESNQSLSKEVDYFSRSVNDKLVVVYSLVESKTADPNWLLNERSLFASKQELLDSL